jgi:hypothetical protein
LQKVLETPGSARAFRDGFQTGVIAGGKALVVDTAKLIGKGAQLAGDASLAGYAGDAVVLSHNICADYVGMHYTVFVDSMCVFKAS